MKERILGPRVAERLRRMVEEYQDSEIYESYTLARGR